MIDLYFTPSQIKNEAQLSGSNVVVVDVLRASTTIATALKNGARCIIPADSVETALKYVSLMKSDEVLLCGERGGKIIEGFDLGNSPFEYTRDKVKGKTLIYASTNGSVAIVKSKHAKSSVIGGFVNASKVVDFLKSKNGDILFLCSGKLGRFCIEDTVCAGMIIDMLSKVKKIDLTDSALAGVVLYRNYKSKILNMLKKSEHGRFLIELGFEKDLEVASKVDSIPILPCYSNGVIKVCDEI